MFVINFNILYSCGRTERKENILNTELNKINNWLCSDKLLVNLLQTNFLLQ